jgi:hypothetical protein
MRCGHGKGGAGVAKDGRRRHACEGNHDGASAAVQIRQPKLVRARGGQSVKGRDGGLEGG